MSNYSVLIISLHADPASPSGVGTGGGTHAYLREVMSGLALRGRHFCLVTRRADPAALSWQQLARGCAIARVDLGPPGPMDKLLLDEYHETTVEAIRRVWSRIEPPPGVIHSVYWNSGRAARALSHTLGIPYVHTVISNGLRRHLQGAKRQAKNRVAVERLVFTDAETVISVSLAEKRDLIDLYGLPKEQIVVVGRPVADVFRHPAHNELGTPNPPRVMTRPLEP